jgi:hypothetical protein
VWVHRGARSADAGRATTGRSSPFQRRATPRQPVSRIGTPKFGAFGYAAETIEASLAMGELSLLPAVRRAEPDTLIVADGTSCRHQIGDGTGREALHVARVLARAVISNR